jgi:predicted phage terminase large subunit-like protein
LKGRKQSEELLTLLRLQEKRLLQNNFYFFCKFYDPKFFTDGKPHLKLIADSLQDVSEGKIKILAISLPPRAGKSYIVSLYCAWLLGKEPSGSVMRNSYAATLAEKFSKDIRDGIVPSEKYKIVFDATISKTNAAVGAWSLQGYTQPSYFCAGVGGAITGFGCKTVAILDDSLKNIEEALSETVIENVWSWYTSTHLSRLETGCPEVLIATRWTRQDIIGRLTDENSEQYNPNIKVISIPALTEEGKSFCEEIKTTAEYLEIKRVTDDFIWEAEFMQNPVESKGLLYPIEELKRFSLKEISTKDADGLIGFCDTADKGSDYLCALIGSKFNGYTYITNIIFTQDGVEITEPDVAQILIDTDCTIMKIEANNGGESYARNVRKLIRNSKCSCQVIAEQATTNKETRILMAAGYVKEFFYFRNDYEAGSDYDKYMRQLTSYVKLGKNKHDDAADATTGLSQFAKTFITRKKMKPKKYNWDFEKPELLVGEQDAADRSYIDYC